MVKYFASLIRESSRFGNVDTPRDLAEKEGNFRPVWVHPSSSAYADRELVLGVSTNTPAPFRKEVLGTRVEGEDGGRVWSWNTRKLFGRCFLGRFRIRIDQRSSSLRGGSLVHCWELTWVLGQRRTGDRFEKLNVWRQQREAGGGAARKSPLGHRCRPTGGRMGDAGDVSKEYAAGFAAGIATVITGHPFDTIKVVRSSPLTPIAIIQRKQTVVPTYNALLLVCY